MFFDCSGHRSTPSPCGWSNIADSVGAHPCYTRGAAMGVGDRSAKPAFLWFSALERCLRPPFRGQPFSSHSSHTLLLSVGCCHGLFRELTEPLLAPCPMDLNGYAHHRRVVPFCRFVSLSPERSTTHPR